MITNDLQLAASLRYAASFADMLEGMRRHALERHDGVLFPLHAAGPLDQVRQVLADARAYVEAHPEVVAQQQRIAAEREEQVSGGNGHALAGNIATAPIKAEKEAEAAAR